MVQSLMNLMDSLMDEFQDEAAVSKMDEREIISWIEVRIQNQKDTELVFFLIRELWVRVLL